MTIMREERAQDAHDLDNVTYNLAVVVALLAVGSVLLSQFIRPALSGLAQIGLSPV